MGRRSVFDINEYLLDWNKVGVGGYIIFNPGSDFRSASHDAPYVFPSPRDLGAMRAFPLT
jgi:hypothetical protein